MILGRERIQECIASGSIVCDPAPPTIEATHIDLHLGRWYYLPKPSVARVHLATADPRMLYTLHDGEMGGIVIPGHTLALAHTAEAAGTTVPNLLPTIETRSTLARWGITVHLSAGIGDPGYCSHWTLEIKNEQECAYVLPIGARVACLMFHEVEGNNTLYEGRYNTRGAWKPEDMLPRRRNI